MATDGAVGEEAVEQRRKPRAKKRMTCGLNIEGRHYSGFVLDISSNGLYVQTSARPAPGTLVDLELSLPTQKEPVRLRAKVARQKLVPPELRSVAQGGIGLHVDEPPQVFADYYASVAPPDSDPAAAGLSRVADAGADRTPPGEGRALHRYRVRVSQTSGPRSRTITLESETLEEARQKALAEVGEGWKILSAEAV